jgi:hypothetical protein
MNRSKKPRRPSTSIIYRPVFREYIDEYGEVVKTFGRERHKLTATFFQVHDNIFELHCKLDLLSILLLNYFGRVMGENSIVHFNRFEKNEFITFIKEHGGKEYTVGSIDNALLDLKKVEAIRALGSATFYVNARYVTRYINNDERKRRVTLDEERKFKIKYGLPVWTDWLKKHLTKQPKERIYEVPINSSKPYFPHL